MVAGTFFKGLKEFIRSINIFGRSVPDTAKDAGLLAAEMTVDKARPEVPYKSGRAAESLRVEATPEGAEAVGGGDEAPHYAWLEYGGMANHTFREIVPEGRYLYPASLLVEKELQLELDKGLEHSAREAGLDPD